MKIVDNRSWEQLKTLQDDPEPDQDPSFHETGPDSYEKNKDPKNWLTVSQNHPNMKKYLTQNFDYQLIKNK